MLFHAFLLFCDIKNMTISKATFATIIRKSKAGVDHRGLDIHMTQFSKTLYKFEDMLDMLATLFPSHEQMQHFVEHKISHVIRKLAPPVERNSVQIPYDLPNLDQIHKLVE